MIQIEPKVPLDALDPVQSDPAYWQRFQAGVMASAGPELARRRRSALTIPDVMLSWSRLLIPTAVAAAAVAALVLVRPLPDDSLETMASLEEFLQLPTDGAQPLPAFLHSDEAVDRDLVLFAVEGF